jgi:hypothetical protein
MRTYNPYAPNPYIQQGQQQDIGGLSPVFQNIAAQQANQNAAIQQGQDLSQQASQIAGQGGAGGGFNNMAMAAMLRKDKVGEYMKSIPAMMQYGAGNVYGGFGQGQVPTTTTGMD